MKTPLEKRREIRGWKKQLASSQVAAGLDPRPRGWEGAPPEEKLCPHGHSVDECNPAEQLPETYAPILKSPLDPNSQPNPKISNFHRGGVQVTKSFASFGP